MKTNYDKNDDPDYVVNIIQSQKITLDEHFYPEQAINEPKHQFSLVHKKIVEERLER